MQPVLAPALLAGHEAGLLQDADMPGHPGEGHRERRGEVRDAGLAVTQSDEDCPPYRVGERRVLRVERRMFNHSVDFTKSQPL
jgi:hypothetical protein